MNNFAEESSNFDSIDLHHFEKDEVLGSFLVRIAQQCEKNKDVVGNINKFQHRDLVVAEGENANSKLLMTRRHHVLQCMHDKCKDQLYKHVTSFYHNDGFLDIKVRPHSKSKNENKDEMQFEEKTKLQQSGVSYGTSAFFIS